MENQLQKINRSLNTLNEKEVQIAVIISHVNYLIAYPLNDAYIEAWAKIINELLPDLEIERLNQLLLDFKFDKKEWNYKKGIQNILSNLKPYIQDQQEAN